MIETAKISLGLIPVLFFLGGLIVLDSFKLIKLKAVIFTIIVGCLSAGLSLIINRGIYIFFDFDIYYFTRYVAPTVEEILKSLFLIYLIRCNKVGFMVDAAIRGFAIGAGFALVENIFYWTTLDNTQLTLWIVRGFGTAAMHGGTMAIFGIISKSLSERKDKTNLVIFLPGLVLSIILHSIFNHFILPPLISTAILLSTFSLLVMAIFHQSEKATRHWLGSGLDTDLKLFEAITTGKIMNTRIGVYLESLNDRFPVRVVADMLCLIRVHLELSMRAKGILLMRQSSLKLPPDEEVTAMFEELEIHKKSIGRTGLLAIQPYLQLSSRDLWQIYMLNN